MSNVLFVQGPDLAMSKQTTQLKCVTWKNVTDPHCEHTQITKCGTELTHSLSCLYKDETSASPCSFQLVFQPLCGRKKIHDAPSPSRTCQLGGFHWRTSMSLTRQTGAGGAHNCGSSSTVCWIDEYEWFPVYLRDEKEHIRDGEGGLVTASTFKCVTTLSQVASTCWARPFFLSLPHKHTSIFMNCFTLSHAHTQFACCSPFHVYFEQFNSWILSDSYVTHLTFCHQASAFLLSHAPSFFKSALDVVSPAPLLASRHYFEHVASTRGKKLQRLSLEIHQSDQIN